MGLRNQLIAATAFVVLWPACGSRSATAGGSRGAAILSPQRESPLVQQASAVVPPEAADGSVAADAGETGPALALTDSARPGATATGDGQGGADPARLLPGASSRARALLAVAPMIVTVPAGVVRVWEERQPKSPAFGVTLVVATLERPRSRLAVVPVHREARVATLYESEAKENTIIEVNGSMPPASG